jgi:hypothetical protein
MAEWPIPLPRLDLKKTAGLADPYPSNANLTASVASKPRPERAAQPAASNLDLDSVDRPN